MARLGIQIVSIGMAECRVFMTSLGEACTNAHFDEICDHFDLTEGALMFDGMAITAMSAHFAGGVVEVTTKPTPAMLLFIGWLMTRLPARAHVVWRLGWPIIFCPPHDSRDDEGGPDPLTPQELVAA